jgi:hypothetical protein
MGEFIAFVAKYFSELRHPDLDIAFGLFPTGSSFPL